MGCLYEIVGRYIYVADAPTIGVPGEHDTARHSTEASSSSLSPSASTSTSTSQTSSYNPTSSTLNHSTDKAIVRCDRQLNNDRDFFDYLQDEAEAQVHLFLFTYIWKAFLPLYTSHLHSFSHFSPLS